LVRAAARLGSATARDAALERCQDATTPEVDRIALVELLGQLANPRSQQVLLGIFTRDKSPAVRLAAVSALGSFQGPEVAGTLIDRYALVSPSVRDRILSLLCTRPAWASTLLEAIARNRVAAKDLTLGQVQQLARLGEPALLARLDTLWGKVPQSGSPQKLQRIAEVRGLLPEGDKGNPDRGKPIFQEHCAVCHRLFGQGETIGPDLTGADRGNLDFLLTSLVDPSAAIRKEYQAQSVALQDGRVMSGLIVDENDRTLTLVGSDRQRSVIPRSQVEEVKPSDVSLMPEGLLEKLSEPQIRDLFRYLQSRGAP
jgi:putative heme-binding domain-containing protein